MAIRAPDTNKIGWTANLAARLRALATGSAVPWQLRAATPGGQEQEALRPDKLSGSRRHRRVPGSLPDVPGGIPWYWASSGNGLLPLLVRPAPTRATVIPTTKAAPTHPCARLSTGWRKVG
jgi:hypothetical protein